MNGLLRHTGNIHKGLTSGVSTGFWGVIWNNIKSGFVFMGNGYSSLAFSVGLVKCINI